MKQVLAAGGLSPLVKARSTGVKPEEMQTALGLAAVRPPLDTPAPIRLSLLNTTSAGRVLSHAAAGEAGYFSHALLNLPAAADAQLAIQTWGSPQWHRRDPDTTVDLPDLPYLPVADVLDDDALRDWLASPRNRDTLEFALTALLATPADTRIVLGAAADDVALVVYAVTRSLPHGLLDAFTFSTYEPDALTCPARLIGADPGAGRDLPDAALNDPFCGFHPGTGRKSDIVFEVPFAAFAVKCLADGEYGKLDEVKASWQRLGLTQPRHFDLVFRLTRGTGVMTKDEAGEALQYPSLASWVSGRQDAMNQFLDWALEDREFAGTAFSRAVQALRQKPEAVAKLAQTVKDEGLKALKAGEIDRTATALEVILPMAAPSKAQAIWGELLAQLTAPDDLPWPVRWYLLPRFARYKQQSGTTTVEPVFAPWLGVPAEKLAELLALDLPRVYHLSAVRGTLAREGEPGDVLAATLTKHPKLALSALAPASAEPAEADRTVSLFDKLLAVPAGPNWFDDVFAQHSNYPAAILPRFLDTALAANKIDADRIVRSQGPKLLDVFAGATGLDRIGHLLLAAPPADLLGHGGLLAFLGQLKDDAGLTADVKARAEAVLTVKAYLDDVSFAADRTAPVAAALKLEPAALPGTAKGDVFAALARELAKRGDETDIQAHLEAVVLSLGDTLAAGPADLFENLLRDVRGRVDLGRNGNLAHAFLATALGATTTPELGGKLEGLDGHAFAVAADVAKRGGAKGLTYLDGRAAAWPREARTKWGFLLAAVRPQTRLGRDVLCFVVGAIVAAATVWVVK